MNSSGRDLLSAFDFDPTKKSSWHFIDFPTAKFERLLRTQGEEYWQKKGAERAFKLFHATAKRVPAYKDFLRRHQIHPGRIRTITDFERIPLTDKKNYIQHYPLAQRCWDGNLASADLIAMSSGTSGHPTAWPRGKAQEFEAAIIHELIYRSLFGADRLKTLLVIGFPMGVYVSGVATLLPSFAVAAKGYPLTVVSAGNNKQEMLRAIENLQDEYEQILLVGHPLFIKDIIESGEKTGVNWKKQRVRMMFCSEDFSEEWRRYVLAQVNNKPSTVNAISTYGSSEMLLMGHETPYSIAVRNTLERVKPFQEKLFGAEAVVPNLFQYNPFLRYIEAVGDDLVFTSASGIPLIRYNLHDRGRVISFDTVHHALTAYAPVWRIEFPKIKPASIWKLPFIALWGRSEYKIVFYAANIYPEHVRSALSRGSFFHLLTGKFAMRKGYAKNMDEYLEINIELRAGVRLRPGLTVSLQEHIVKRLQKVNMEYLFLWHHLDKDIRPRIKLRPYQDKKYFKPGLKPRSIID